MGCGISVPMTAADRAAHAAQRGGGGKGSSGVPPTWGSASRHARDGQGEGGRASCDDVVVDVQVEVKAPAGWAAKRSSGGGGGSMRSGGAALRGMLRKLAAVGGGRGTGSAAAKVASSSGWRRTSAPQAPAPLLAAASSDASGERRWGTDDSWPAGRGESCGGACGDVAQLEPDCPQRVQQDEAAASQAVAAPGRGVGEEAPRCAALVVRAAAVLARVPRSCCGSSAPGAGAGADNDGSAGTALTVGCWSPSGGHHQAQAEDGIAIGGAREDAAHATGPGVDLLIGSDGVAMLETLAAFSSPGTAAMARVALAAQHAERRSVEDRWQLALATVAELVRTHESNQASLRSEIEIRDQWIAYHQVQLQTEQAQRRAAEEIAAAAVQLAVTMGGGGGSMCGGGGVMGGGAWAPVATDASGVAAPWLAPCTAGSRDIGQAADLGCRAGDQEGL